MDRETFLAKTKDLKLPIEAVTVADLGTVYVRMLGVKERDVFEATYNPEAIATDGYSTTVLIKMLCDNEGNPILTEADRPMVEKLPSGVIVPIVKAAIEVNRFNADRVDELAKNS